ncbi:MAG: hypothetical protein IKW14_05845 [Phascolarctobacterium sp.]|nr:hypothetical protein [Phascolarctobacterium sp.]
MQPYVNPNYYAQYQQQINPYVQRMENLQQFQQVLQQPPTFQNNFPVINKVVENIDMVKVADIPMDGNMYYFPKADGTEIYTKQFGIDGRTRILTFKPVLDENTNNLPNEEEKLKIDAFNDVLIGIQKDIKELTEKVDKITKPSRTKKEVVEDE